MKNILFIGLLFSFWTIPLSTQNRLDAFFTQPDTLNKKRFYISAGTGLAIYTGFSIALWEAWYKDSEIGGFRTFNDWNEWQNMDKVGHFATAWIEAYYAFKGAEWTGLERRKAMWLGVGIGLGLQTTIEVMDGFSADWGFSWGDMAFNAAGVAFFAGQEMLWQEQRFKLKFSANPVNYPDLTLTATNGNNTTVLQDRIDDLYGSSYAVSVFKDYNAQTYWVSANVHSFLQNEQSKFPKWLNIAVGHGAGNMFGGFGNSWTVEDATYSLSQKDFPRFRQFYLSFDVDLSRLPIKNKFLRFLIGAVNWIKIPAPSLEVNTLGGVKFHPIYW